MKRHLIILGAVCALLGLSTSCLRDGTGSRYEANIYLPFDFMNPYELAEFIDMYFDGGQDSVLAYPYYTSGPGTMCAKLDDNEQFTGGFALCYGVDTLDTPDRAPARFAVYDEGGNDGSILYAVYHDTLSTCMPTHAVTVAVPNSSSLARPQVVYVQNVQAVVQAVRHGNGLSGGPFGADDYLTLTVSGSLEGKSAGEASVKLVDGTRILDKWTQLDLSKIGNVDALDFRLSSSRSDLPLYCAVDDLVIYFLGIYN